mmetsp:Transcript_21784/g.40987  ORF Transcript_21784/g.40987 Transcript_21784/m.40987 type:complete len:646 (+) Transcript_21784:1-1938(+)
MAFAFGSDFDELVSNTITAHQLQQLTGFDDLTEAQQLSLTNIDTGKTPVDHLGELLPNLVKLRVGVSVVPSFRDLGTKLRNLQVLWLSRCHVNDLSGIFGLPQLEELYLSFNDIKYLEDISMHENIGVLDLEANQIEEFEQVEHLGTCLKLNSLTLSGCPVTTSGVREKSYRRKVVKAIPNLMYLDDIDVGESDRKEILEDVDSCSSSSAEPMSMNMNMNKIQASADLFFSDSKLSHVSWSDRAAEESKFIDEALKTPRKMPSGARPSTAGSARRHKSNRGSNLYSDVNADDGDDGDDDYEASLLKLLRLSEEGGQRRGDKGSARDKNRKTSSSLTHGTDVVFAGGAARGLRKFNGSAAPFSEPRMMGRRTYEMAEKAGFGGGGSDEEVEYEVAGDKSEFKAAINELKSWRLARSKGGWCPDGKRDGSGVLKIREGEGDVSVPSPSPSPSTSRPTTAPNTFNHKIWASPKSPSMATTYTPDRSFLDTPSSSSVGGITPRNLESRGGEEDVSVSVDVGVGSMMWNRNGERGDSRGDSRGESRGSEVSGSQNIMLFAPSTPGSSTRDAGVVGEANKMDNLVLIEMLKKKPKDVEQMKTRNSFRKFFRGMSQSRLQGLLRAAYQDTMDEEQCEAKVKKRVSLMEGWIN